MNGRAYTPEEDAVIRRHYRRGNLREVARRVGRPVTSVSNRITRLGLNRRLWNERDDQVVRAGYGRRPIEDLAGELGRTVHAVKVRAQRLGLRQRRPSRGWSETEIQRLEELYPTAPMEQLEEVFGRPADRIISKANRLRIRRRPLLSKEGKQVLWEMRDVPGAVEYVAQYFELPTSVVERALERMGRDRGGVGCPAED